MRRTIPLLACVVLAVTPATAAAKKKHKKPVLRGPIVTVTAIGNVASNFGDVSTAVANCPPGTVALGGGFAVPSSSANSLNVFSSYRSDPDSWTVAAMRSNGSGAAVADAYCRRATRPIADATGAGTLPNDPGATGAASATCPPGSRLIGGGFESTVNSITVAFPLTNMSTALGTWSIVSVNSTSGTPTITAHAYCMTGIRAPILLNSQGSANLPQYGSIPVVSPACPVPKKKKDRKRKPRRLLSAGGFSTPIRTTDPFVLFTSSMANVSGWIAAAQNMTGPTASVSATSQGICV